MKTSSRRLAAAIVIAYALPFSAFVVAQGKPRAADPCGGGTTQGTFNLLSVGALTNCEYGWSRQFIILSAEAPSGSLEISVQAPSTPGTYHCVGDAQIVVSYHDTHGLLFAAISSDGKATDHTGTCTINVTKATDAEFAGTVDATVRGGDVTNVGVPVSLSMAINLHSVQ